MKRAAPGALLIQGFAVLAVPLAFCCCVSMAADLSSHGNHDVHHHAADPLPSPAGDACPHHGPGAIPETTESDDPTCPHVDRLVMALAGLVGTTDTVESNDDPLAPVGVVRLAHLILDSVPTRIDIPPPRV